MFCHPSMQLFNSSQIALPCHGVTRPGTRLRCLGLQNDTKLCYSSIWRDHGSVVMKHQVTETFLFIFRGTVYPLLDTRVCHVYSSNRQDLPWRPIFNVYIPIY
jgi:hypothetical protein